MAVLYKLKNLLNTALVLYDSNGNSVSVPARAVDVIVEERFILYSQPSADQAEYVLYTGAPAPATPPGDNPLDSLYIRHDVLQTLNPADQARARQNIGLGTANDVVFASLIYFGAINSTAPMITFNGSELRIRKADNSVYVPIRAERFKLTAGTNIAENGDGKLTLLNDAGTNFTMLQFGGVTNVFPAFRRNGIDLEAKLADDSGYTSLYAKSLVAKGANSGITVQSRTGTGAFFTIYNPSGADLRINNGTTDLLIFDSAGILSLGNTLSFTADNSIDIGSNSYRARDIYIGGSIKGSNTSSLVYGTRGKIAAAADGVFGFYNNAGTGFTRLALGGITSAFPAIARNGAGIDFVLADATAAAAISALKLTINGTTGTPSGTIEQNTVSGGLKLSALGTNQDILLAASGTGSVKSSSDVLPSTNNGNNLGSASFYWNHIYVTNLHTGSDLLLGSYGKLSAISDGVFALYNNAGTGFTRLDFGGVTSAFPAVARNGAGIDIKLADNSALASLQSGNHTIKPAAGLSALVLDVAAINNRKISFTTNAVARWDITVNNTAEGGANAGSDFAITSANDAGNVFTDRLTINRATGLAIFSGNVVAGDRMYPSTSTSTFIRAPSDGLLTLYNNAATGFTLLQFGGTTASFPAIKRNAAAIEARLADDSTYAGLRSQYNQLLNGSVIKDSADGSLVITNAAGTGFTQLNFGGTTASFPAIARSGVNLEFKLADNSGFTGFKASTHIFANGSIIKDNADGILQLSNAANTDFSRLQFGGSTASFPSLKRSTTELHARLADDSAFANFQAAIIYSGGNKVLTNESIIIAVSDETTALATGTGKTTFRMPYAFILTEVRASLTTAQTSGSVVTVNVKANGTTIFSTKPTLDNTEKTTTTAATPSVLSTTALADDTEITIDIDQVGDGTAKGLKITLIGKRP